MDDRDFQHFVCIVASNNPQILIDEYNKNNKSEKYVLYRFSDRHKLYNAKKLLYESLLLNNDMSESEKDWINMELDIIKSKTPEDYYAELTEGMEIDNETGDALTEGNRNGKFINATTNLSFANGFKLKDGTDITIAKKGDIDWEKLHGFNSVAYEIAWDVVVDGVKPYDKLSEDIYNNMKDWKHYLLKFKTKDNYVKSSTSFWAYAFLSEETGWVELGDNEEQFEWSKTYFDRFIKPLSDNTLLTIYECTK